MARHLHCAHELRGRAVVEREVEAAPPDLVAHALRRRLQRAGTRGACTRGAWGRAWALGPLALQLALQPALQLALRLALRLATA